MEVVSPRTGRVEEMVWRGADGRRAERVSERFSARKTELKADLLERIPLLFLLHSHPEDYRKLL